MVLGKPGGKKFHLPKSQTKFRVPKESGGVNKKFKPLHPIASSVTRDILLEHESSSRGGDNERPMSLSQGSVSSKKTFSLSKNRLHSSQTNGVFKNKPKFNVKSHTQKNIPEKTKKSEEKTKDINSNSNLSKLKSVPSNLNEDDDLNTTIDENETGARGSHCNEEDSTPISSSSLTEESVSDEEEIGPSTQDTVLLPSTQEMIENVIHESPPIGNEMNDEMSQTRKVRIENVIHEPPTLGNSKKNEMSLTRKGDKDCNKRSKNKKDSIKKMKMMERNIAQIQPVQKKKKIVSLEGPKKVRTPIKKKSRNENQLTKTLDDNEREIDKNGSQEYKESCFLKGPQPPTKKPLSKTIEYNESGETSLPEAPHTIPNKSLKEYKIKGKYKKIIDLMEKEREKGTYVECCQCKKMAIFEKSFGSYSCSVPQVNLNTIPDDEWVENTFTSGSLVWAKIDKDFTWWPAMIDDDPDTGKFCWIEESESNVPLWYHVLFFNRYQDLIARSWIEAKYVVGFAEDSLSNYKVESSYLQAQAIKETLSAKLLSLKERRKKYGYIFRYKGFWKLPWDKKLWGNTGDSSEANNSNYTSTSCDDESESEVSSLKTRVDKKISSIIESSSEEENVANSKMMKSCLNNQDKTFNNMLNSNDEVFTTIKMRENNKILNPNNEMCENNNIVISNDEMFKNNNVDNNDNNVVSPNDEMCEHNIVVNRNDEMCENNNVLSPVNEMFENNNIVSSNDEMCDHNNVVNSNDEMCENKQCIKSHQ
ncbi:unnamed protein product [Lepeophtheirus salmonis]|uniref:(salmon louse) hypothetical protein n=1 Tax=Lepeophtheirus salmonis TaxID=72036 RepID=A0A7R8CCX8_LEPSM|nr:unnamed protein product [Lepeophtheirus salmonis]CAF2770674.1 unnamed protein product [Lepeophtheirus salmonis]